ncbi:MAG: anthranilate phosphoribosyltransferase, partial [Candidatus Diapherotrites archaeon]|nr:anthranilate phosphoribosyltransferase [Candidatus Diapherotrites archaeon]
CGKTTVFELKKGKIKEYTITPEEFGFRRAKIEELQGGEPKQNAEIILQILKGEKGPKRDIVLFNAGAALYAAEKTPNIKEGIKLAEEAIDSGKALKKLEELRKKTNEFK